MRRVLVPGGRVLVSTPPPNGFFDVLDEAMTRHVGNEAGAFVRMVFSLNDLSKGGKGCAGTENGRYANRETALMFPIVPIGLIAIAAILFTCAVVNLFTKQVATIAGIGFPAAFFVVFVTSERVTARRRGSGTALLDQFQLETGKNIDAEAIGSRPGGVLVPVRDYNTLSQLDWVLDEPESEGRDVVVLTVRVLGQGQHGTLGAHAPHLSTEDIERIHQLWVEAVQIVGPEIHHSNVVAAAIAGLESDLHGSRRQQAVERLREHVTRN